jgi:tetratricopeptide (TPR) repeat protein
MRIKVSILLLLLLLAGCSTAPEEIDEIIEKKTKAAEYAEFGNDYYEEGLYEKSLQFFELALAYNGSVDNREAIGITYNSIGKVFMAQGQMDNAEYYYNKAYSIALELNSMILLAQCSNNLGELYYIEEDYDKALELFLEALKYAEDESVPDTDMAIIYHNLGSAYKRKNDYNTSLEYFMKALEINVTVKKFKEAASNNYMIASIYSEQEDYDNAVIYIEEALLNDKKVENSLGIAKDYIAMGLIYKKQEKYEEAYAVFKRTLFIYLSLKTLYPDITIAYETKSILNHLISVAEILGLDEEAQSYRRNIEGEN